jgi:hypothetical protein
LVLADLAAAAMVAIRAQRDLQILAAVAAAELISQTPLAALAVLAS